MVGREEGGALPCTAAVRRRLQTQWGWLRAGLTLWHVRGTKKRDGEF